MSGLQYRFLDFLAVTEQNTPAAMKTKFPVEYSSCWKMLICLGTLLIRPFNYSGNHPMPSIDSYIYSLSIEVSSACFVTRSRRDFTIPDSRENCQLSLVLIVVLGTLQL